jgi:hypothetical protein
MAIKKEFIMLVENDGTKKKPEVQPPTKPEIQPILPAEPTSPINPQADQIFTLGIRMS